MTIPAAVNGVDGLSHQHVFHRPAFSLVCHQINQSIPYLRSGKASFYGILVSWIGIPNRMCLFPNPLAFDLRLFTILILSAYLIS